MNQAFIDYYRCPRSFANFVSSEEQFTVKRTGYFKFGPNLLCYGNHASHGSEDVKDLLEQVQMLDSTCILPFDPTEVANCLRYERYVKSAKQGILKRLIREAYYAVRPLLPVRARRHLQKMWLRGWDQKPFPRWPVDRTVDQMFVKLMQLALISSQAERIPFIWFWPEGKSSCAMMTHDVETDAGLRFCNELMDINDSFGLKSSFQLIPDARYNINQEVVSAIRVRGFEVNLHDLKHDGHLFENYEKFQRSVLPINQFAVRFGCKGFRSGALYRNQEWVDALQVSYDMSVPNVGHLDPQSGGCCTVMPYFVNNILELPVTTIQDYSLFNVLETYSQAIWERQIELIMEQHGLISFIVHPDYLDKPDAKEAYRTLLKRLSDLRSHQELWIALPGDVDAWWRQRDQMQLVADGENWKIEGSGAERARVAYASIYNDGLTYAFS